MQKLYSSLLVMLQEISFIQYKKSAIAFILGHDVHCLMFLCQFGTYPSDTKGLQTNTQIQYERALWHIK